MSKLSYNSKMSYKTAIKTSVNVNMKTPSRINYDTNNLNKGWIFLTNRGIINTLTNEERQKMEKIDYNIRANKQMNEIVNRFWHNKRKELQLEGYDDDEIESIIDNIIQQDCEIDDNDLSDEEEYYSNSDDEGY